MRILLAARWVFGVIVAAAFILSPASAQEKTYLDEYRAYNQALETGDQAAASSHARAAWQAAEAELGDDSLTAILAYNYGQLVLFSDTEAAAPALRRAEALRAAGVADLPISELALYLAYAEFVVSGKKRRQANALRNALVQIDAEGLGPSDDTAAMWLQLASADLFKRRYSEAYAAAIKAESEIASASPNDYQRRAEALLVGGIAKIVPRSGKPEDLLAANKLLVRAGEMFPPQKSIEDFNPVLAQILAWNSAAGSALSTFINFNFDYTPPRSKSTPFGGRLVREFNGFESLNGNAFIERTVPREDCQIEWESQQKPSYPAGAANMGHIGAAIIGYNFGDDTGLHDVIVISEVPTETFSKNVLKAMSKWRLKNPPRDHPSCRDNFIMAYSFIMDW